MSYNLKPGTKRIAKSTGEPDKRQRDNKSTSGNTDSLKPSKSSNMSYNLKPGTKRIAKSTGEPDKRQRDNKNTPGNTDSLKPSKSSKK